MNEHLLSSIKSHVLYLTINRPVDRNALNRELVLQLTTAFNQAASNSAVRAILLSGAGTDAFCAGADLRELADLRTGEERGVFFRAIADLILAMSRCPKPIVTKVHGYALAGGCGLVAASDIAIASEEAIFGLPEIKIGIAPLMIIAPLSRTLSRKTLADLVLTGDTFTAQRAFDAGLISRLVAKNDLDTEAESLVTRVAKGAPRALAAAKEALWSAPDQDYANSLFALADKVGLLAISDDALEGVTAFTEKRRPTWKE